MKYLVMECHAGYAVLMDEASRFVRAANLHYEVGQTVTSPILMEEAKPAIRRSTVIRIAAAAACVVLLSGIGLHSYLAKKTRSSIRICSELEFEMQLNRAGEVISISSSTENGQAMLDSVSVRKKDLTEVVGELLTLQREQGYIAEGETVSVYIDSDDDKKYEEYKSGVETEAEKLNLQVSVQPPQPPHEHDKSSLAEPLGDGKPGEQPPKPGEEPPHEALHTGPEKPDPPTPPDGTKAEKGSTPAGPGTAAKAETGTRIRHPEPPAEHGTEPADAPELTEPQVTVETQPADAPVPPDALDIRGLPHTDPLHHDDEDTPADPDAPVPPHEMLESTAQPELNDDSVPAAAAEQPEADGTEETEENTELTAPESPQEPAAHPAMHPPVPQAAENPRI